MNTYTGVIIEESLENREVLKNVKVLSTEIEKVTERFGTPWLTQWTLHKVEIPESDAEGIAHELSISLDPSHDGSWYADFKNDTHHYVIFRNKIFFLDRSNRQQYDEMRRYGLSIGTPEHQLIKYGEV
jgi:hypothetical protein